MSSERQRKRAAEIAWSKDRGAIVWVGQRTLHHFWPLLSPYFRDVLLPPLRRSDDDRVSWIWREADDTRPPTASELATVRKRLGGDQQAFAENLRAVEAGGAGHRAHGGVDQLGAVVEAMVEQLIAKPDAELATFFARTEAGPRLHSWGAPFAAAPFDPDARRREAHAGASSKTAADVGGATNAAERSHRRLARNAAMIVLLLGLVVGGALWWPRGGLSSKTSRAAPTAAARGERERVADMGDELEPERPRGKVSVAPAGKPRHVIEPQANAHAVSSVAVASETTEPAVADVELERDVVVPGSHSLPGAVTGSPLPAPAPIDPKPKTSDAAASVASPSSTDSAKPVSREMSPPMHSDAQVTANEDQAIENRALQRVTRVSRLRTQPIESERILREETEARAALTETVRAATLRDNTSRESAGEGARGADALSLPRQHVRFAVAAWETRLVGDVILPTFPTAMSQPDSLDSLGAGAMEQKQRQLPRSFRTPSLIGGYVFEVNTLHMRTPLEWHFPNGARDRAVAVVHVREQRVEIGWPQARAAAGTDAILRMADGRVLAHLRANAEGATSIDFAADVAAAFWVSLELESTEAAEPARFAWRTFRGESPSAVTPVRVELPLRRFPSASTIALIDRETGWALQTKVSVRTGADVVD